MPKKQRERDSPFALPLTLKLSCPLTFYRAARLSFTLVVVVLLTLFVAEYVTV